MAKKDKNCLAPSSS